MLRNGPLFGAVRAPPTSAATAVGRAIHNMPLSIGPYRRPKTNAGLHRNPAMAPKTSARSAMNPICMPIAATTPNTLPRTLEQRHETTTRNPRGMSAWPRGAVMERVYMPDDELSGREGLGCLVRDGFHLRRTLDRFTCAGGYAPCNPQRTRVIGWRVGSLSARSAIYVCSVPGGLPHSIWRAKGPPHQSHSSRREQAYRPSLRPARPPPSSYPLPKPPFTPCSDWRSLASSRMRRSAGVSF